MAFTMMENAPSWTRTRLHRRTPPSGRRGPGTGKSHVATAIGVHETEPNIRNKIARGGFTAVFLLQVMAAIGVKELRLD